MFQTEVVEKNKTHFVFADFRKSCSLWSIVEKYATDDSIIRSMRFACQMIKAADTNSEYAIPIAFLTQQWLRERHTYVASRV
jgi:hypothetical protein